MKFIADFIMNMEIFKKFGSENQEDLSYIYDYESRVLGLNLPKRDYFSRNCQYGAPFVAANYCGIDSTNYTWVKGEWQHGWHPPEHNVHPELVVGNTGLSRFNKLKLRYWVARKDQADYLLSCGYKNVEAIGLPIIYLPELEIERQKNSLLVMPVHSLSSTTHNWDFEQYAGEIYSIKDRFTRVIACIHPECIQKKYWVESFMKRGIPVISGAEIRDKNSLLRMAYLFKSFDFLTTNGFGSHLAYGSFFGAKVSIFGSLARYSHDDFKDDFIYKNCPELLPIVLNFMTDSNLKKLYSLFFVNPWEANCYIEWGKNQPSCGAAA